MPVFERQGVSLAYDVYGRGYPILLFAPGGMRSRSAMWPSPPTGPQRSWCDWTQVLAESHQIVAMDQRNAGRSRAPISPEDGWDTYAADHLALMDHLGYERFHVLGGCIGSSFSLKLSQIAPARISAAVLQNPIGLHPDEPDYFPAAFADWSQELMSMRPDLDANAVAAFGQNMWDHDFVFSVDRAFARRCPTPSLVLPGNDIPHPRVIGLELADLIPGSERLVDWKGPQHLAAQRQCVTTFLARHTP